MGRRRRGQVESRTGRHAADPTEGPDLLLLLHGLAQVPCPEQWAQSKMLLKFKEPVVVPGSRRGGVLLCGLF